MQCFNDTNFEMNNCIKGKSNIDANVLSLNQFEMDKSETINNKNNFLQKVFSFIPVLSKKHFKNTA